VMGLRGHWLHLRPLYTRTLGDATHSCPIGHTHTRGVRSEGDTSDGLHVFLADHSPAIDGDLDIKVECGAMHKQYHSITKA